jgi:signal transduction histidine kinase
LPQDPAHDSARLSAAIDERQERFAALIRAERGAILEAYAKILEVSRSPVAATPRSRDQAITDGGRMLAEVTACVQGDGRRADDRYPLPAWMIEPETAGSQPSLADRLRAAMTFFDVTVNALAAHASDDPELLPCFFTAILALNESIGRRLRQAVLGYTGYLLERVDQAHTDERRRIARDLHDRLGEGMSVALRQLELHELNAGATAPGSRVAAAKEALTEAMRRLRLVTFGLREEPVRSLERALVAYIDSAPIDTEVRLRVSGDEQWAPPTVIEETFFIIREAIRNALKHGTPRVVQIGVALAPHELHAWVEDDGCGFAASGDADRSVAGTGLTSMRERAALLGGRLTIASTPGRGAQVELLVPLLPGHRDA